MKSTTFFSCIIAFAVLCGVTFAIIELAKTRREPLLYQPGELIVTKLDGQKGLVLRTWRGNYPSYRVRFPVSKGGYQDVWMSEAELVKP